MKKTLPLAALGLSGALVALPALEAFAEEPSMLGLIGDGIKALGVADYRVQIAAVVVGGVVYAWKQWLNRPQAAAHTVDELFALMNGMSERIDTLAERMDRHIDRHHAP